ncbi:MAG TPA: ABC transporter substrate-binding protein [candidate division Zixibacteria bacterium]|nr:ABC transporter substrate-binding protein [candidate division Zixibacteria bacterium]
MFAKRLATTVLLLSIAGRPVAGLPQEKVKLRVSSATKTLGYGPLWIARQMGFYERQGLDVDLVVIRSSDVGIQALAGGSLEIAGSAADAPIAAVEKGLDLVLIGGIINGLTQSIMAAKRFKTYSDLRGATFGAISLTSGVTFALRQVLKAKGLEYPRDYRLLVIGGSPQTYAALTSGQIDAAALSLPLNYAAEELGFNEIGRFVDVIPNYQLASFSVKRSWAEKNPGVLVRFAKAMALAFRWIHGNREPAVEFLAREMKLKPEHARRGWEFYTANRVWHPDGDLNLEGLRAVAQIYFEQTQGRSAAPNVARYVDRSYLAAALKELR